MIYENVKRYCKEHGLSIFAFEQLCGIGNGTIARWENDKSRPTLQSLEKMAKATGTRVIDWMEE